MTQLPDYHDLDPYKALDLTKDPSSITAEEIKKAYRKKALKCHPDKATSDEQRQDFHNEFQTVAFAYSVLSDPKRRQRYDRTGSLEQLVADDEASIADLFSDLCKGQVTKEMIEQDKKDYRESGEEERDILDYYKQNKGDLDVVFENVLHSDITVDEERFRSIIQHAIDKKEVPAYKRFTKETEKDKKKRLKAAQQEAVEAEELAKELGLGKKHKSEDSLALLIKQRGEKRFGSLIDSLEEKYGGGSGRNKKNKRNGPSEEEFEAIQKSLKRKAATKVKGA
jgi:DnaJ family protein C protein 9